MNSASLLADAGHSLSDLTSDFVTLYTFRKSRKPPDATHPYGYGKYETIGSLGVSTFLILGALGIGHHAYELLLASLPHEITTGGVIENTIETIENTIDAIVHHENSSQLNPNAAWHHRSDAASSLVALASIVGSYFGFPLLDPIGGILVAGMIMKSGINILITSLKELVDVGMEENVIHRVNNAVQKFQNEEPNVVNFHSIRGRKSGPFYLIDMVVQVKPYLTVMNAHSIEEKVREAVKKECKSVKEVLIHLDAYHHEPHH
ncbi:4011_t:CDS:2 [Diversispora eburnea]|uniref:4011_t:CDS:1 n=1 Tax=Diversispora eburnea TaxID=1213867 RepID=A0A9N9BUW7_9GLOM|nr:4011_t:CDS:2 [Diversispora eburnea]